MALINCPECSKEISDKTISCPNCGYPINNTSIQNSPPPLPVKTNDNKQVNSFGIGTIILCAIVFYVVYSIFTVEPSVSQTDTQKAKQQNIDLETKASTMIATYEDNEVRADAIYKGKVLKVTGIVHSISSDFNDKAVVRLAPKNDIYALNAVSASGDIDFHNKAIELKKGTMITIICIGDGEVIGSPQLKNCRF